MLSFNQMINQYKLDPHPEGGYFKEVYRSDENIDTTSKRSLNGKRSLNTAIYYLLGSDDQSSFHRIKSDEIWHLYAGGPLDIHVLLPDKSYKKQTLSADSQDGSFVQIIPKYAWFAAKPVDKYVFAGCTVAPGFDFHDFEMAEEETLLKDYPAYQKIIRQFF